MENILIQTTTVAEPKPAASLLSCATSGESAHTIVRDVFLPAWSFEWGLDSEDGFNSQQGSRGQLCDTERLADG